MTRMNNTAAKENKMDRFEQFAVAVVTALMLFMVTTFIWGYMGVDFALEAESRNQIVERIDGFDKIARTKAQEADNWAEDLVEMQELAEKGNPLAKDAVAEFEAFEKRARDLSKQAEKGKVCFERVLVVYDLIN